MLFVVSLSYFFCYFALSSVTVPYLPLGILEYVTKCRSTRTSENYADVSTFKFDVNKLWTRSLVVFFFCWFPDISSGYYVVVFRWKQNSWFHLSSRFTGGKWTWATQKLITTADNIGILELQLVKLMVGWWVIHDIEALLLLHECLLDCVNA